MLQLSLMEWSQPRVSLEGPAPRGRHTAEAYGTMLLIFGGGAEGKVFDDMWALDIDGSGTAAGSRTPAFPLWDRGAPSARPSLPEGPGHACAPRSATLAAHGPSGAVPPRLESPSRRQTTTPLTPTGLRRLERAASKAGLASGPSEAEQRKGLEGAALSFLLPQMGERPPVAVEPEYDDVEAREADADEVGRPGSGTAGCDPHVLKAATPGTGGCDPVRERLQPRVCVC